MERLEKYFIDDLVADPSFQNYVKRSNVEDVRKWEQWQDANPERVTLFQKAIALSSEATQVSKRGRTIL
jgi:hypothetical protein